MSGDSLIFDMSQMTEGSPSVFVKRDWLNIQDQQNGNYGGNQLVIDTSQLANSNKYMAYREAYLAIPLTLAASSPIVAVAAVDQATSPSPLTSAQGGVSTILLAAALNRCYIGATLTLADGSGPVNDFVGGGSSAQISDISTDGLTVYCDKFLIATPTATKITIAANYTGADNFFGDLQQGANATPDGTSVSKGLGIGLKSWFGSLIHSMTLDYAGTTIIQQTPWQSMWTMFGLMTTLSISDLEMNACTIGFYPDAAQGWTWSTGASPSGVGVCNNLNTGAVDGQISAFLGTIGGNPGMLKRQTNTLINPRALPGGVVSTTAAEFLTLQPVTAMDQLYRSRVYSSYRTSSNVGLVYQIQAQIMLKHLHPFFSQVPLLKGVFFRLTLNLNQPEVVLSMAAGTDNVSISSITSPLGGVVPIMVSSKAFVNSSLEADPEDPSGVVTTTKYQSAGHYAFVSEPTSACTARISLNVGNTIISQSQKNALGEVTTGLNRSCFLYVPSYTFNPSFEEAYLSRPTKQIVYTDIYQFTTSTVAKGGQFNFLLTNGISNVKSVLILPFFPNIATENELGAPTTVPYPPYQSPFDPAGTGPVSPMIALRNFNVVVAGQNMIYNTQQYNFEQFLNQLVGVNSVNANLTDGLTSGLVDFMAFQQSYGYYYCNTSRMLPIDEAVPKSVSIQGTNESQSSVQFLCFIEYGVQVSVDVLTGSRV